MNAPWTEDETLRTHRFTNVYRASDRVSQYMIRRVIYDGPRSDEEVVFRTLFFKVINRIGTWELLADRLGPLRWRGFDPERYLGVLDEEMARGTRLYSAAYIMPSPKFGFVRKHANHVHLLVDLMKNGLPSRLMNAKSLGQVYEELLSCHSFGSFLAFQFAIDLNYSEVIDHSEMSFVVAGPGAKSGIRRCFSDAGGLCDEDLITAMADIAEGEFDRLELKFETLWGRSLQLIDCQNLFCEVDKYSRVAHPDIGGSGRTRIKQRYAPTANLLPQWYPPKWGLTPDTQERSAPENSAGSSRSERRVKTQPSLFAAIGG